MRHLLALGLVCALQAKDQAADKRMIAWSFSTGHSREMSWKGRSKVNLFVDGKETPGSDCGFEMVGTFKVEDVDSDGSAAGLLRLHHQGCQGLFQGNQLDILVKDGQLKQPEGTPPESFRPMLQAMLATLKIRATRLGTFEPDARHPFFEGFSLIWGMLGPILPDKLVAPGDTWIATLPSPRGKGATEPGIKVKYTFVEMIEVNGRKCARITLEEKQRIKLQGADTAFSVKSNSLFDPDKGECVQCKLTGDLEGSAESRGQKMTMSVNFTMEFETLPTNKK